MVHVCRPSSGEVDTEVPVASQQLGLAEFYVRVTLSRQATAKVRVRETGQRLGEVTAPSEDPGLVFSTHTRRPTTT